VSNPFGIKNQPVASSSSSSSSSSKHLQPSNSDAPFEQPSSSKLSSTTSSKPSKLGKKSSNKLPDSSEEEEEEKEKVTNVGGVEFKTMVRKKVMLSPGGLAKKRAADELKAVMKPGEEYDELVDTEEDEEVDTVVDLRKKKKEVGRKEVGGGGGGRTELKAKRSILEIAAEEMEAGLKDKEDKERKLKHYGEDEEVYETGELQVSLVSSATRADRFSLFLSLSQIILIPTQNSSASSARNFSLPSHHLNSSLSSSDSRNSPIQHQPSSTLTPSPSR